MLHVCLALPRVSFPNEKTLIMGYTIRVIIYRFIEKKTDE